MQKYEQLHYAHFLSATIIFADFFPSLAHIVSTLRGSGNPKKDSSSKRRGGDGNKKENRLPMLEPPPRRRVALRQPNNRIIIQHVVNIRLQQARDHNATFLSILLGILLRNPHGTPHWHKQAPTVPQDRRKPTDAQNIKSSSQQSSSLLSFSQQSSPRSTPKVHKTRQQSRKNEKHKPKYSCSTEARVCEEMEGEDILQANCSTFYCAIPTV